ncbi:hypothetical protein HMPREF1554_02188 [Porphyromonas gingivalis F0569]|nr:hypothetical protein HMPREF1554_02188 [Porphyromonas gingivalis F0569]
MHFNCTIQELKPMIPLIMKKRQLKFQLHHTGIKTDYKKKLGS